MIGESQEHDAEEVMGKFVMVAQSRAKEGRDKEYNDWYDTVHIKDICSVPGVKSARRFEATPAMVGTPGLKYLAIYEIEADDAMSVLAEIGKRAAEGKMKTSESLDAESAMLWFYKEMA
jgi:hypothetical protein